MTEFVKEVSSEQKEASAITVMRCMLLDFSEEKGIPFEQAMLAFTKSKTYDDLFDLETGIWKEGPEYLRGLYEEELNTVVDIGEKR